MAKKKSKKRKLKKIKKVVKSRVVSAGQPAGKIQKVRTKLPTTEERIHKTKIRVIGIGGGGSSIVSEIAQKLPYVSFVVANTDVQALGKAGPGVLRFPFGQNFTAGLGTGMNPEIAREAAIQEKEKIKKLFSGYDFCILISCLGAGTGSGASPIFAKIAKNLGLITLGIFTLPFKFEGEKKLEIARDTLQKLRPNLNALIILPNERIFQVIDKNTPLKSAFSVINKNLAENLTGLIETIYQSGLINIDFADLKTILEGQGRLAFLNTAFIEKEKAETFKRIVSNPLYPYSIEGAKGILLNIVGEKELSLSETSQISKMILDLVSPEAKIIFGICPVRRQKPAERQKEIKAILLAVGCTAKFFSEKKAPHRNLVGGKKLPPVEAPKISAGEKPLKKREKEGRESKPRKKIREKSKRTPPIKIKVMSESKEQEDSQRAEATDKQVEGKTETKIRKNALQIRKEAEETEKELLEKEKIWETPAFLRKGLKE